YACPPPGPTRTGQPRETRVARAKRAPWQRRGGAGSAGAFATSPVRAAPLGRSPRQLTLAERGLAGENRRFSPAQNEFCGLGPREEAERYERRTEARRDVQGGAAATVDALAVTGAWMREQELAEPVRDDDLSRVHV